MLGRYGPAPTAGGLGGRLPDHGLGRKMMTRSGCKLWEHPGLVFPSEQGTPMDPKDFYRAWTIAPEAAGQPSDRIHDMRHIHLPPDSGKPGREVRL